VEEFRGWLEALGDADRRARLEEVFAWIGERFPQLERVIKWNQPMFTDHGSFVIGFSSSKSRWAFMIEPPGLERFADEIAAAGYSATANLVRVGWEQPADYGLLERMIAFAIEQKAGVTTFWLRR